MADFKYTTVLGKLEGLLEKLRTTGVPPKATQSWLKSLGYTSSNDTTMITVLKAIGFANDSGVPEPRWREYRGGDYRRVLGEGLREGYGELFDLYPDACARSDAELDSFFRTQTDAGDQVVKKLVGTLKILCANADMGGTVSLGLNPAPAPSPAEPATAPPVAQPTGTFGAGGPALHIDIQVHISPESSAEQIDDIFKSMAKHIYRTTD